MAEKTLIQPYSTASENVLAGWLGIEIPAMPKERNETRRSYRKTPKRRQRSHPSAPVRVMHAAELSEDQREHYGL